MGERFHEIQERSFDLGEVLRCPEQVFDSDAEKAREENEKLIRQLNEQGEMRKKGKNVRFETHDLNHTILEIDISWDIGNPPITFLFRLTPITEGKGFEQGVDRKSVV